VLEVAWVACGAAERGSVATGAGLVVSGGVRLGTDCTVPGVAELCDVDDVDDVGAT
jgi:hypothetical protein